MTRQFVSTDLVLRNVPLNQSKIDRIYADMMANQPKRYADWWQRHEECAANREYSLPKLHDFYSRVEVSTPARDALHVTRRAIESLTARTFRGSQGRVAEWTQVMTLLLARSEDADSPGGRSLAECMTILLENSYDISEGVRFIRTPLALPRLERKYYLTDLTTAH